MTIVDASFLSSSFEEPLSDGVGAEVEAVLGLVTVAEDIVGICPISHVVVHEVSIVNFLFSIVLFYVVTHVHTYCCVRETVCARARARVCVCVCVCVCV